MQSNSKTTDRQPLTVEKLAAAKRLPVDYLRGGLQLTDLPGGGVAIPYHDKSADPNVNRYRIRAATTAGKGSCWSNGSTAKRPIVPYGLAFLRHARQLGYVILGEGESDGWCC